MYTCSSSQGAVRSDARKPDHEQPSTSRQVASPPGDIGVFNYEEDEHVGNKWIISFLKNVDVKACEEIYVDVCREVMSYITIHSYFL